MATNPRWTRDEIGEYHDGQGNLIFRDYDGWGAFLDGSSAAALGPFKTLQAAKAAVVDASERTRP